MNLRYATALLLVLPLPLLAACDCTHFPIQPATCFKPCQTALLLKANPQELTNQFKLDSSTINVLIDKRSGKTSGELQSALPSDTYATAMKAAKKLTQKQTVELGEKYDLKHLEKPEKPLAAFQN